ncbi:MAG TPA: hypothetical protein DCG34_08910, partial [Clostridiales bacterium]|nr:hypothetical protein [Clostridiales bacterium]
MKALFFITIIVLMISCVSAADTQLPTVSPVVNVLGNGQVQLSGTASDTSNDVNVTPGITRVEARLNSGAWVTCSGTTSFEYIFSDLSVGSHVIGVRAIDRSLNPSEIVHVDFSLSSSDVNVKDNDLSWYITIDNLHFETMRDFNNVLTVDTESDVSVNFKISNDHSQPVNLRWIISKGSLEFKDNVQ